jgi:DNA-binding response OmpR family regulator
MFDHEEQPSVLAVGALDLPLEADAAGITHVETGREALEMLRVLRFDLLVTATGLPDMPVWRLVQRVRQVWPWQKWAMVAGQISPRDEMTARTLGVLAILDEPAHWPELCAIAESIRQRAYQLEAEQAATSAVSATRTVRSQRAAAEASAG